MLVINDNVYTLEHGPSDEDTDVYIDLVLENGSPLARILHDGVSHQTIAIRVDNNFATPHADKVRFFDAGSEGYFRAVASVLPFNALAAQVRAFIRASNPEMEAA